MLRARQIWGGTAGALPGLREALGLDEAARHPRRRRRVEEQARALVQRRWTRPAGTPRRAGSSRACSAADLPARRRTEASCRVLAFAATEVVPRLARHRPTRSTHVLHALDGGYVPAGPSGSPLRGPGQRAADRPQLLLRRPQGRPVAARLGDRAGAGRLPARPLPRRHRRVAPLGRPVGVGHVGDAHRGDDIAEVLALLGVRPRLGRGVAPGDGLEAVPLDELGRPRIDVTVRISGFFRDAFPHVVAMLDDAVRLVAGARRARRRQLRARPRRGRPGRARRRPPRHDPDLRLQAGRLRRRPPAADRRRQLARRRRPRRGLRAWGGYAYGRELDGIPARADMERPTSASTSRPRTSTPASTTSPTPTTTSSTTAAWSRRCAR